MVKLQKVTLGVVASIVLAAGSMMLPAALGGSQTAFACDHHNLYKVVWSEAGQYVDDGTASTTRLIRTLPYGTFVKGIPGQTYNGWTHMITTPSISKMKDASIQFWGCVS